SFGRNEVYGGPVANLPCVRRGWWDRVQQFLPERASCLQIADADDDFFHRIHAKGSAAAGDQLAVHARASLLDVYIRGAVLAQEDVYRGVRRAIRVGKLPQSDICKECLG